MGTLVVLSIRWDNSKKPLSTTKSNLRSISRQASHDQSERGIRLSVENPQNRFATGDKAGEGKACGNIGNAHYSLGQFNDAIEYHKKDLEIARQTGESRPIRAQHLLIR